MTGAAPPSGPARAAALAAVAARWADPDLPARAAAVAQTLAANDAFTFESVTFALNQTLAGWTEKALEAWRGERAAARPLTVGVLHAGNVPFGEAQDLAAVVLAGHRYRGVVSSRSPALVPAFVADLVAEAPGLDLGCVGFDELFGTAEAVVATGSDDTKALVVARCEAAGIPPGRRLLRGHRFSAAVLDGRETDDERERLAEDVLLHEGFGCRNVAVVWAPRGADADPVFAAFAHARAVYPAPPSTAARLRLPAAFLKATGQPHAALDDGSLLVSRGDPAPQAPGHLRWAEYDALDAPAAWLAAHADALQLVAARPGLLGRLPAAVPRVPLGEAQRPPLDWHPDGVDTLGWLAGVTSFEW